MATALVGEPAWVVAALGSITLLVAGRATDDLFFVFFGAVCASILAHLYQYKTKTQDAIANCLEAATMVFCTCVVLPRYASPEVRAAGTIFLYLLMLESWVTIFSLASATAVATLFDPSERTQLLMVVGWMFIVFLAISAEWLIKRFRS